LGWFLLSSGATDEAQTLLTSSIGRHPNHAPLHWYLGLIHLQAQRMEEASEALLTAVTFDPLLDEAAVSLAWALGDLGRFEEAEHYSRQALAIKHQPDRIAQLGWLLLSQQSWAEAALQLANALSMIPTHVDARCQLATALQNMDRNDEALRTLSDGLVATPNESKLLHLYIRQLVALDRQGEAQAAVRDLLVLAPDDLASHILAAVVLNKCGDLEAASTHAERAVAQDDKSLEALQTLAEVRIRQDRLDEAASALQTAIELEPVCIGDNLRQLGWLRIKQGKFDDATAAFKSAVIARREDSSSWYGLAKALHAEQQLLGALEAIQHALPLSKPSVDALVLHGQILADLGPSSWDEAVLHLTNALVIQPDRTDIRSHLIAALRRFDRESEALKILSDGLLLSPTSADLLREKIQLLLSQDKTKAARTTCHTLLKLQGKSGMGWYLLALILLQQKRHGVALRALARACRCEPNWSDPWLQTGWIALELGDTCTARDAVARALNLTPKTIGSHILAAMVNAKCGNLAVASTHAEMAVGGSPRLAAAWLALAQVRADQGNLEEAEEALHTALACDSKNTNEAYQKLGWIYVSELRYHDAVTAFTAAVENSAKDAEGWYGLAEANRAAERFPEAMRAINQTVGLRRDWKDALRLRNQIIGEQVNLQMQEHLLNFKVPPKFLPQTAIQAPGGTGAQYEYALCSFCTTSHLPLLRTMAASVREHSAGKIYLLIIDSDDAALVPSGTTSVRMDDVIDATVWQEMVSRYNILELCCTLKPFLMRYVARISNSPVVYLDADTYAMQTLNPALPESPNFSVFLTPHLLSPIPRERHVEEIGMLRVGIYNAGLVAVGTDSDALRFLDWWADRVRHYCYEAPEQGIFTDQKWLDLVPSFFQNVRFSRDIGLNVGPWRVSSESDFSESATGQFTFCGAPVRLMHMSRFNPAKPNLLSICLPNAAVTDSVLGRFLRSYSLKVIANRQPLKRT